MAAKAGILGIPGLIALTAGVAALVGGAYFSDVFTSGPEAVPEPVPVVSAPVEAPVDPPVDAGDQPAPTSEPEPESEPAPAPEVVAQPEAEDTAAAPQAAPPVVEEPALATPSFDLVRVEPDGTTLIAGSAAPGALILFFLDQIEVGTAQAGSDGKFAGFLSIDPSKAARILTMRAEVDGKTIDADDQIILAPQPADVVAMADPAPEPEPAPEQDADLTARGEATPEPEDTAPVVAEEAGTAVADQSAGTSPAAIAADTRADTSIGTDTGATQTPVAEAESTATAAANDTNTDADAPTETAGQTTMPSDADPAPETISEPQSEPENGNAVAETEAPVAQTDETQTAQAAKPEPQAVPAGTAGTGADVAGSNGAGTGDNETVASLDQAEPPAPVARVETTLEAAPETAPEPAPETTSESAIATTPEPAPAPTVAAPAVAAQTTEPTPSVPPSVVITEPTPPAATAPPAPSVPGQIAVLRAGRDGIELLQPATPARPDALDRIALDVIGYSEAGDVQLSGRAEGQALVRVYLDNRAVADLRADAAGNWKGQLDGVAPGVYTLRLDALGADGAVLSRLETPFKREAPEVLNPPRPEATPDDAPAIRAVTVQTGDTLWAISRERYGDGVLYVRVFEANRNSIRDPDLIYPGQIFTIPD